MSVSLVTKIMIIFPVATPWIKNIEFIGWCFIEMCLFCQPFNDHNTPFIQPSVCVCVLISQLKFTFNSDMEINVSSWWKFI